MEIKKCSLKERDEHIKLINKIFRDNEDLDPTMDKEFLCLLGEKNSENNLICINKEEVVGCVNYYHSNIIYNGHKVPVSSVGAVCTREDHRGKNIICKILKEGDKLCKQKESCMLIISGLRRVYLGHGASQASLVREFVIKNNKKYSTYVKEYNDEMLDILIKFYNKEPLKFTRDRDEFNLLLKGAMFNWGNNINKLFIIYENEYPKGYIMIKQKHKSKEAIIREYAGNREAIFKSIFNIKENLGLERIIIDVPLKDELIDIMEDNNIPGTFKNQWIAIKIIDLKGLLKNLYGYFSEYISKEKLDNLKIEEIKGIYKFSYKEENLIIENTNDLNRLIFGNLSYSPNNLKDGELKNILEEMFPLPFVNVEGMNYQ